MMYNLLKGKKGIIFGALDEKSIAWHIAERCHEEGAEFILSNTPAALRFGTLKQLAEKTGSEIVEADATNLDDLKAVFTRAMEKFGGQIDFVLHAIGMSLNVRKNRSYDDVDYNFYTKTMDISAFSFHKMLQTAYKLDAIKEWGSVVALSYVAGQRTFYRYNDMADAKALLESIARSFGYIYGRDKKVRVNTISQSPTMTTAGSGVKGIDNLMDYSDRMSPLGNATAEDCANYCVTLFSDLTKKITMQNLYNDGGFSSMGMSQKAMHVYNASLEKIID
ncbi:MAG: enoyl-ACP reductase [Bacteroidales bacterium]|nr:enoyl-ACP reductase [Bacteroidales bacterium]MBQ4408947.1 enoyl-ACP reductase [Bacteroidales bacterium]MBQ5512137.1 enoyl-ACP reductase [Bacteroidales bacterium]MBQ5550787.1 enoyl-ACP reductase [Bacteroidales bacterium]MBR3711941.1 enoyl-ACP reductase [Bacteroidales bacterium]